MTSSSPVESRGLQQFSLVRLFLPASSPLVGERSFRRGENKKIVKFARAKDKVKMELKAAKEDLRNAKSFLKGRNFKYATIAGYYSLFHSARALLYSRGYRERSHYCLRVAIKELFVKEKLLDPKCLNWLEDAVGLREAADYESLYSRNGAEQAVEGAKKFLNVVLEIFN